MKREPEPEGADLVRANIDDASRRRQKRFMLEDDLRVVPLFGRKRVGRHGGRPSIYSTVIATLPRAWPCSR